VAFQVMVGAGMITLLVAACYWLLRWKARRAPSAPPLPKTLLAALTCCAPLGFIALEAGWVVTEAGRQPWVIYKVMRTADAVTPVTDIWGSLLLFSLLYAALAVLLVFFLRLLARDGAPEAH
jgi:cytochrome d ubiquinol oxidase subunit I